ncbi:hypothetical protein P5V15_004082 [Pogonomyrmex californicus]
MPHDFYATTPELNFVPCCVELQSCKGFETKSSNRDFGQDSMAWTMMNYYSHGRARSACPKGTVTENKPWGCPKCDRYFTVKGNMTRHYKYECGKVPRFQCPYCEFRSKQTSNVRSHIRTRHPGQRVDVVHLKDK